jgi:hypothetical protein
MGVDDPYGTRSLCTNSGRGQGRSVRLRKHLRAAYTDFHMDRYIARHDVLCRPRPRTESVATHEGNFRHARTVQNRRWGRSRTRSVPPHLYLFGRSEVSAPLIGRCIMHGCCMAAFLSPPVFAAGCRCSFSSLFAAMHLCRACRAFLGPQSCMVAVHARSSPTDIQNRSSNFGAITRA